MSSLQQYLNTALTIDNQESSQEQEYQATKDQLKAMGEGLREQALASLPFSIAEISRGVSGLYRTLKQGQALVQRKGGIGDFIEGINKGSDEPFDIGKLASKLTGAAGDQIVERYGAEAKRYGVDLGQIREASKTGGLDAALEQTKTQLKTIADKNISRITETASGKAAELSSAVKEFAGKSVEELKTLQSKAGETLKAYSPEDISKLSESAKTQYASLTDMAARGEATPEGLARLKTGTASFTRQVGMEREVGRLTQVKDFLGEQATIARKAIVDKTRVLTDEHTAKMGAADERINKLQLQKETADDIVSKAQGRLTQNAEDIFKSPATTEDVGAGISTYRSAGSMTIGRQVQQSQSSIDEALVAKHQTISEGLDRAIQETQAGKQQLVTQFNSKLEEVSAPIKEQLAQIAPKIQSATEVAETLGAQASRLGGMALEGLGHVAAVGGLGMGIYQAATGQLQTADEKASVGINIAAGGKATLSAGKVAVESIAQKLAPKVAAPAAAEGASTAGGVSAEEVATKTAAEGLEKAATKTAVSTGAELGTEAAVEAGSSVVPLIGEGIDVALGLAMGIQSLVDIFGGHHEPTPPPPPAQIVSYQHQQGIQ